MYKWSLLLLASIAVFQPIASFTERNLVDGRQQCCDHQPNLLQRDARLPVYGNYRLNKVAPEDRRLNDQQRDVLATRRFEVRGVESAPARETESLATRRDLTDRSARIARFDRRAVGIDSRDQISRHASRDRFSRVSIQRDRDYRDSQIRISRDVRARVGNNQRERLSMDSRREQRLPAREITNMRDNRAFSEGRETHRTRNDVVQDNIRNRRMSSEAEFLNRRNSVARSESRRENIRDNNKENRFSERRVRDVSQSRLPIPSSRAANENRRLTSDNRMRELDLSRRVRESFNDRRIRETLETRRDTDSRRVRALNERDQTREGFRQERRVTSADRRFENTVEREVRLRIRPESAERNDERQSRRVRENIREYNNARDTRRNTVDRRLVRSVERSLNRDTDMERRQLARSQDRRSHMAVATRRSLLSRDGNRNNMVREDIRRDMRDMRETERRSLDHEMRRDRRVTIINNEFRSASEDRIMSRRNSYDAEVRSRNMERRMDRASFRHQSTRIDARSNNRDNEQERQENRQTSERRMERSRQETRLVDERSERQAQRFDSRNQRSTRLDERSNNLLRREARALERYASRTHDARINRERIEKTREVRNREAKTQVAAEVRERAEDRSRLGLAEAVRSRREFTSKSVEQESFALNWQYLFYTLQGVYLCSIIATIMKEKPDSHKSRSWWGFATKSIKVD